MLAAIGLTSNDSVVSDATASIEAYEWLFLAFGTPLTKRDTRYPLKQTRLSF